MWQSSVVFILSMVHHTALYICFSSPHIPSTFYLITRTYAVATGPGLLRAITPLLVTYRVFRATKGRKRRRKEKAIQINCATLRCWHVAGSNATGSNNQPGNLITRNHSFDVARNLRDDHHSPKESMIDGGTRDRFPESIDLAGSFTHSSNNLVDRRWN